MTTPIFDKIADVYDETRRALDDDTLNGIKEMLTAHGCHSVLEIGVGTGRIAIPLTNNGFGITGMDISRRMMDKARVKGFRNLILAEGSNAPFRKDSFDATIMVHVFHLLDDPLTVVREAARVSRVGVFALVRKRTESRSWSLFYGGDPNNKNYDDETRKFMEERRERFRKIFLKYGRTPDQVFPNWKKEQDLLDAHPPDDLKVVSDIVVTENVEDRINRFESGSFSSVLSMPDEMRKEIVEELRSYSNSPRPLPKMPPRHEVYQIAMWRSDRFT